MANWSGIYLRQALDLPALVGGSGAMAAGRLATGWAVARLGNRGTLLGAGLLTAAGMALAFATTLPALVVGGFLLVGLAISGVAPLAFSAAGDVAPNRAGAAVLVLTTFGYGGLLLGPVVIGGLAELVGLRTSLGTIIVAGLAIFALSSLLRRGTGK